MAIKTTKAAEPTAEGVERGNPSTLPEYATRKEVSIATGLTVSTLARWTMEGIGPKPVKLGGAVRYRKAAVLAWLDSLEEAS